VSAVAERESALAVQYAPRLFGRVVQVVGQHVRVSPHVEDVLKILLGGYLASYSYRSQTSGKLRPYAVLLRGPPGVGKSTLPVVLARALGAPVFSYTFNREALNVELFYREKASTVRREDGGYEIVASTEPGPVARVVAEASAQGLKPVVVLNEVDKIPPLAFLSMYEAMNDGVVTSPHGARYPVEGLLVLTANDKRYDPTSREVNPVLMDRVSASYELPYYSVDEAAEVVYAAIVGVRREVQRAAGQKEIAAAASEVEQAVQVVALRQDVRRCAASVVKVLQGEAPGPDASYVASRVRRRPGERAAIDIAINTAVLYALSGILDEEVVRGAVVSALLHRVEVVQGEDKVKVIEDAIACSECARFFRS